MSDDIIRIIFEKQTDFGMFRDALYLPADHGYSEEEIEAMKQVRVDNWISVISNPSSVIIEGNSQDYEITDG